jgi:hypothetical protein
MKEKLLTYYMQSFECMKESFLQNALTLRKETKGAIDR